MTREQLDAIRARARSIEANKPRNDVWLFVRQDVPALLAEVEGMRESCTGLVKQNERQSDEVLRLTTEVERLRDAHAMAVQVSGELCEKCGWSMKFPGEKCRCELVVEVERLTADPLPAAAWVREVERAAFKRGVAAMREAAVAELFDKAHYLSEDWADDIRALPDPEDTE